MAWFALSALLMFLSIDFNFPAHAAHGKNDIKEPPDQLAKSAPKTLFGDPPDEGRGRLSQTASKIISTKN